MTSQYPFIMYLALDHLHLGHPVSPSISSPSSHLISSHINLTIASQAGPDGYTCSLSSRGLPSHPLVAFNHTSISPSIQGTIHLAARFSSLTHFHVSSTRRRFCLGKYLSTQQLSRLLGAPRPFRVEKKTTPGNTTSNCTSRLHHTSTMACSTTPSLQSIHMLITCISPNSHFSS